MPLLLPFAARLQLSGVEILRMREIFLDQPPTREETLLRAVTLEADIFCSIIVAA